MGSLSTHGYSCVNSRLLVSKTYILSLSNSIPPYIDKLYCWFLITDSGPCRPHCTLCTQPMAPVHSVVSATCIISIEWANIWHTNNHYCIVPATAVAGRDFQGWGIKASLLHLSCSVYPRNFNFSSHRKKSLPSQRSNPGYTVYELGILSPIASHSSAYIYERR